MNLAAIRKGDLVLLDANIIIYAITNSSAQCRTLLTRCATGDVQGIIGGQQLAEVVHRLMLAEARENGWITGGNPARQLAGQPERIRRLSRYEDAVKGLIATGVRVEPVQREDFFQAMSIQRQAGLMTNDALMAAVADRLRVEAIASADKTLTNVRGLVIYQPDDLNL
jgi:predicted nucleic acid-binding protein